MASEKEPSGEVKNPPSGRHKKEARKMMDPYHGKVILLVCLAFFGLTDFGSLARSLTARQAILKTAHRQAEGGDSPLPSGCPAADPGHEGREQEQQEQQKQKQKQQ